MNYVFTIEAFGEELEKPSFMGDCCPSCLNVGVNQLVKTYAAEIEHAGLSLDVAKACVWMGLVFRTLGGR